MGLFKSVMKKVALLAAIVVGKRVITKVAGDISQKRHKVPAKTHAKPTAKLRAAKTKAPAKAAARPKAATKPKAAAKPKAPVTAPASKPETPAS